MRRQSRLFLERHLTTDAGGHCAALALLESALRQLAAAPDRGLADPLRQLAALLLAADLSPFELLQAGLVPRLTQLLTAGPAAARRRRLRAFLHAMAGAPATDRSTQQQWVPSKETAAPLATLVAKLNACVAQQEQLPVKAYDVADGVSGHSALRYFTDHQLKVRTRCETGTMAVINGVKCSQVTTLGVSYHVCLAPAPNLARHPCHMSSFNSFIRR